MESRFSPEGQELVQFGGCNDMTIYLRRPERRTARHAHATIVTPQAWEAARQQLLVKEKAQMRATTRWPPNAGGCRGCVEQAYAFEGPTGTASLLDLFEGRRQLIIYRLLRTRVFGWPEHAAAAASLGPIRSPPSPI